MHMMTMTTTSSSSAETINTKQLSRIGSSCSSSGCSTSRTTATGAITSSSGSGGTTPTPSSSCSTSRSNKSVLLIPNNNPNNNHNLHNHHHHHHHHISHHNHNGHHHHHLHHNHHPGPKAMTERWFLCSSTARTEARLLAMLDLISSIAYLIIFGLLTYAVFEYPELIRRYLDEVPENQDIARLLTYGNAKKAFFLSVLILRPAASLFIAILLFVGAQKRNYSIVRLCFIISIIYITVDMILFIPKTIYTQNGKIYVITYLFNVVYMLYELWVTYELKKEVKEWHEKHDSEDAEPETEDTTVVGEGESAAGDE